MASNIVLRSTYWKRRNNHVLSVRAHAPGGFPVPYFLKITPDIACKFHVILRGYQSLNPLTSSLSFFSRAFLGAKKAHGLHFTVSMRLYAVQPVLPRLLTSEPACSLISSCFWQIPKRMSFTESVIYFSKQPDFGLPLADVNWRNV